jgi:glycosyltransferase involved in cell wall biosynthesis
LLYGGKGLFNKRILQLIGDLEPGGAENLVVNLSKSLKSFNIDVSICSREGGSLLQKLDGVPTHILLKNKLFDWKYLLALSKLIRSNKIDIVHTHLFGNNFYGFLAAIITKRKVILTIHGEDCLKSKKRIFFYRVVAPFVSKIVTVSKPLYRRLLEDLCLNKEKVSLIINGIDTSLFNKSIDIINQKRILGFPVNVPLIGAIGNIKPVKGYDILLNAAVNVHKELPNAYFIIIGGVRQQYQNCMKYLKALAVGKNILNKVFFIGERNDVEKLLPILDVYVLPSRSEGTSIAMLEAMASGRPIVATKVGGTVDIIENNKTGLLVPPEDPASLAKAIMQLLKNQSLAKMLGEQAQLMAEKEFSVGSMIEKYLALYDEVLNVKYSRS